jgi:hypothetical protein
MHNAISLIILCRLHSVTTSEHLICFRLKNSHACRCPMFDLQRVSCYIVKDSLYHSCTTKLVLSLKLIERF